MTPRQRLTFHRVRLLLALTATLAAYTATPACAAPVHAPEPGPTHLFGSGHPAASGSPGHVRQDARQHGRPHDDTPDAPVASAGATDAPGQDPPAPAEESPVVMPSDSASASFRPADPDPSRAGSLAGQGRMRPGRPDGPAAEVEGDDDVPTQPPDPAGIPEEPETADPAGQSPAASQPPEEAGLDPARPPLRPAATQNAAQQSQDAGEPVLDILPLGSGLVFIGLGLGLAFLGLRLRKS
ncbi:hypothetical protein [Streptomyces sp. NPDC127190]|uniref:hypothetical protein n=1 Tax=unclassified Streptomyces TaxID=2593676 RepID=UPI003638D7EE